MSFIQIKGLKKNYGNLEIFKNITVNIEKGDVIAIIGPSGTGKSTFLRSLNFLETTDSGEIWMDGINILSKEVDKPKICQKMGMVFQSFNLFPNLMVIENVMKPPMDLLKMDKDEAYELGMSLLEQVGMKNKYLSYPDELSGGQKQRVAIARALAMKPEILLLDEPTSALDPKMVGEVQNVIRKLADSGMTMMIVTHEMRFAKEVSNRAFYMDEGGIYEEGPSEILFNNPQKPKTRAFLDIQNHYFCETDDSSFDLPTTAKDITTFGISNGLEMNRINRLNLIIEELCVNRIIPKVKADPVNFSLDISYDKNDKSLKIISVYNGEKLNLVPEESTDDLSITIIRQCCEKIEYKFEDSKNILTLYL